MELTHDSEACTRAPKILRESHYWILARVAQAYNVALNEALAPHDLTLRTFAVLAMVGEGTTRTQLEIAQIVGLDKSTLVATIDDLERRALVERRPDPNDRRARTIEITTPGRALLTAATEAVSTAESHILASTPAEDAAVLKSSLFSLLLHSLLPYADAGSCF